MSIEFMYNLSSMLSQYGVSNTGNLQTDLAALKKAMQAKGQSTTAVDSFASFVSQVNKTKNQGKTSATSSTDQTQQTDKTQKDKVLKAIISLASLMQQLGLRRHKSSPEADFAAMSQKLAEMSASATTPEQQANIASLQSQVQQYASQAPQGAGGQGVSAPNFGNSMLQNLASSQQSQNGESNTNSNGRPTLIFLGIRFWNQLVQNLKVLAS